MDVADKYETDLKITDVPNHSLLLEMLDIGSGDIIPMIFQFVTSLKEKVRLERVCRRFREHALTFKAWSNIKSIRIFGGESSNHYLFNDDLIPAHSLSPAIESVFWHSRNVRYIDMLSCHNAIVYSLVAKSMKDERNLLCKTVEGLLSPEVSATLISMIDAVKSQLIDLQLVKIRFEDEVETYQFWTTIEKCLDLKLFKCEISDYLLFELLTPDLVKTALRGKAIQRLQFDVPNITATDLVEIVSAFSNGHLFHSLQSNSVCLEITDFIEKLPLHLNNICFLKFIYCGNLSPNADSSWSTVLQLPLMCPKLESLSVKYVWTDITSNDVVAIIVSYLNILNKRADQSIEFELTLNTKVLDRNCWEAVFASLTNNHQCCIQPSCDGSFRIWCGGQSQILLYCYFDSRDIF